ncbi:helix-turn-helix transcriptional regulator [Paraburkholderia sp. BL17N1]|uniref:helix-turn-helix transcriptional regulator n=1 Tax=Paraburkholderia sp. BL17N1 TaxID=1938798 RepID=UPI000EB11A0D|nr:helix-turn-helix transcriptional regulator [Paraburkholderia sp. BL17N1]RKR31223.1 LuxR family transcriptional regulator [Paraburkholderia sp. BL17N1]
MTRVEAIHRAIRHIYGAVLAPNDWPAALGSITEAIGAQKVMLNETAADAAGLAVSIGIDPVNLVRLRREFETRLPDWIKTIPVGTPLRQSSAISDADFRRLDIYNEVVRPEGGFYSIVAPLARSPRRQAHFLVGRELGAMDFSDVDLDAANLIVPHLMTALEVQGRLAAADLRAQGALDVVAQLNVGVILLDAAMRPVFVNPCAEALAARRDGLLLNRETVIASQHSDTQDLRRAIATAARWHDVSRDGREMAIRPAVPMRCCLSRQPPRPPLIVSVVPVCRAGILGERSPAARVILFVMEPDRASDIDPIVLVKTFQLTRREAALANLLAGGIDLADAASRLGIGIGTARGYLKQILAKTYTHRQAELVALLLRSSTQLTQ